MATITRRKTKAGSTFWELSHGCGPKRVRFRAGRTNDEAEGVLAQFKLQLRQHQEAPMEATIAGEVGAYRDYLVVNRRPTTVTRYIRVLETFAACFMAKFHPEIERLRDIRPAHIEEFKRRRSSGEIVDEKSEHDIAWGRNSPRTQRASR